jgi:hypothetical protein
MGIFSDMHAEIDDLERRAWQRQLARFLPDKDGIINVPLPGRFRRPVEVDWHKVIANGMSQKHE